MHRRSVAEPAATTVAAVIFLVVLRSAVLADQSHFPRMVAALLYSRWLRL